MHKETGKLPNMMDVAVIEANAMQLKESDRAILADRLIQSITPVSESLHKAWDTEINSRMEAFREGEIKAVDGPIAMDALLERFAK